MITDKLLDEMPFRDVTEFMIIDNEQNNAGNYMYNMSTNNDCLVEFDPDQNMFENGIVKKCSNYDTSLEFNKISLSLVSVKPGPQNLITVF